MIRGVDLFDRDAISPDEKLIVKMANKTAEDLFRKRYSPDLRDNWDVNVKDLTLELVERDVIQGIHKLEGSGRAFCKKLGGNIPGEKAEAQSQS